MSSDKHVIIVAGGKGLRMGADIPKQFLPLGGRPLLMWTIESFLNAYPDIHIVLVLPDSFREYWQDLCKTYHFVHAHELVSGGETRFHSVKNGLEKTLTGYVAVHDGARPFASEQLIGRCFDEVKDKQAVIPVIPLTDSCRELQDDGSSLAVDRSRYRLVQTPQVFSVDVLKRAYATTYLDTFTDDASVVEATGRAVFLLEGETTNIKITHPIDIKMGEWILQERGMQ